MSNLESRIIFAKNINLDRNYINVLDYSEDKLIELLNTSKHFVASRSDYSFINVDEKIYVDVSYDLCLESNYIAFQNKHYSNKWFFAWIDNIKLISDSSVEISYTVDSWSTWFSYWNTKTCFVSREHVSDDTVGLHTIHENLSVGQIICDNVKTSTIIGSESYFWFVIACNYNPSDSTRYAGVGIYANYPQGNMWFAWLVNILNPSETINNISEWVYEVTKDGQANNIQTMFAMPFQAFNLSDVNETTHLVINGKGNKLNEDLTYIKSTFREFNDYTPKNNKLLIYPYSFLRISNNMGSVVDYKIEDFHEVDADGNEIDEITFNAIGVPCQGYSGKLRPKNYQGVTYNEDESISLGKYPTFSWSSDGFTNWITQNAINLGISTVNTAIGSTEQIVDKNIIGGISTIATNTASMIGSMFNASMGSNTARGNANAGDVSFSQNLIRFKIMHMRPKKEYLQIIDDYFTRFGYLINRVKIPNITGRKYWNYVEIGSSEEIGYGEVPAKFMDTINNACRKGVTIWHSHSNIGNFNLDNSII